MIGYCQQIPDCSKLPLDRLRFQSSSFVGPLRSFSDEYSVHYLDHDRDDESDADNDAEVQKGIDVIARPAILIIAASGQH